MLWHMRSRRHAGRTVQDAALGGVAAIAWIHNLLTEACAIIGRGAGPTKPCSDTHRLFLCNAGARQRAPNKSTNTLCNTTLWHIRSRLHAGRAVQDAAIADPRSPIILDLAHDGNSGTALTARRHSHVSPHSRSRPRRGSRTR